MLDSFTCIIFSRHFTFFYRVNTIKLLSSVLVALEISWILFPVKEPSKSKWTFFHVFSFAIHYGSQFWMTFIAGKGTNNMLLIMKRVSACCLTPIQQFSAISWREHGNFQ